MVATTGGIADGASRSVHRYPAGAARGSAWTSGRDRAPPSGWRGGAALPGWCGRSVRALPGCARLVRRTLTPLPIPLW